MGLLKCQHCGLVVSPEIWSERSNEKLNKEWFGDPKDTKSSCWVRRFEAWNNRRTLARLDKLSGSGLRLLEVGIGTGSFLQLARDCGFNVMGCDLSTKICQYAERQHGFNMHCGPISTLVDRGSFDVIVANHVLEHVDNPVAFLKDLMKLLTPGGTAHIAVPNIDCWEASFSGWASYEPYHLAYYSSTTLTKALAEAGLNVDKINTHDSFSGWFLVLLRTFFGINRGGRAMTERPRAKGLMNGHRHRPQVLEAVYRITMIYAGFLAWPLRWVQAKLGYGDEIVCIARRLS